jgi:CBS domain-containing protein
MEVDELRRLMLDKRMRYLPIMEGDTLLGVISFHDVARAVLEEQGFENRMLKAYISDWPQEEARV